MRVLIILKYIPSATHDRKSDALRTTIAAHEKAGLDVVLLTSGRSEDHQWQQIDVTPRWHERVLGLLFTLGSRRLAGEYRERRLAERVEEAHKKSGFDIVLAVCTADHPALHARAVSSRLGIPYVVWEHKNYEKPGASLSDMSSDYLRALQGADAVVAVSPQLARIMRDLGVRHDIGFMPVPLSDGFFTPPRDMGPFREWAGHSFLFAAWTHWRQLIKREDLLLKAFEKVRESTNSKLLLAGPFAKAEHERWVRSFIIEEGLEHDVWLYGFASRPEIHQIAHSCDCAVLSSDRETFGLMALEGLAAGRPVVTTRCNGPEFLVDSEELGRTVEKGSVEALAQAMLEVVCQRGSFDSDYIKKHTYERFSCTAVAPRFPDLYRSIAHREHNQRSGRLEA